jgi:type II secretory pathway pseudopilin PulG
LRRERPNLNGEEGFSLIEAVVTILIFAIVLTVAFTWLIASYHSAASSTAKASNNAEAQNAVSVLDADVRFASDLYLADYVSGALTYHALYVQNGVNGQSSGPTPSCTEWYLTSSGRTDDLMEAVEPNGSTTYTTSIVAKGITNLSFLGNSSYSGLISVSFTLNDPGNAADLQGVSVNQVFTASNMSSGVTTGRCGSGSLPILTPAGL